MKIIIDEHKIEIPDEQMKYLSNVSVNITVPTPNDLRETRIGVNFDTAVVETKSDEEK